MSVKYVPVQWNRNKWMYDGFLLVGVGLFLGFFLHIRPDFLSGNDPRINAQILNARAFGVCAFLMLSIILSIGPLARLDPRFSALLYNRRHFGVMTAAVALTHFGFILNWYFAFSKSNKYEALLFANTNYGQIAGFPFEMFGLFALICLLILSTTSHDFWLKFLTAPVWKRLHYLIYPAYAAVVAHVALGMLQDASGNVFPALFVVAALIVAGLHVAAFVHDRRHGDPVAEPVAEGWFRICKASDIREGRARIGLLPNGERVAVFRQDDKLSAISNACAHQNGPLGEGRIVDCLVTCPWHGFNYDVRSGRSPAPFTEKIPTYNLKVHDAEVYVDPNANEPGTYVEPVEVPPLEGEA
ncbi:rieske 2Fe-2S domain protein [Rhodobacteraceae bacterium KLH11]|nr:rieske 2Fe-2S domain protein [Rhodobacteraceae bacterium KLH11]